MEERQRRNFRINLDGAFKSILEELEVLHSPEKQEAFLLGAFLILEAFFKLGNPEDVGAFGREEFMGALRSYVYSKTGALNLPAKDRMWRDIESGSDKVAESFTFARNVQQLIGQPISLDQQMTFKNIQLVEMYRRNKSDPG
jgi:hypothetical protein